MKMDCPHIYLYPFQILSLYNIVQEKTYTMFTSLEQSWVFLDGNRKFQFQSCFLLTSHFYGIYISQQFERNLKEIKYAFLHLLNVLDNDIHIK